MKPIHPEGHSDLVNRAEFLDVHARAVSGGPTLVMSLDRVVLAAETIEDALAACEALLKERGL